MIIFIVKTESENMQPMKFSAGTRWFASDPTAKAKLDWFCIEKISIVFAGLSSTLE